MDHTPLRLILTYALVGLIVAGGVVTFSEITSKVVPVFPRNGQLALDFTLTPTITIGTRYVETDPSANFTLNVTTDSILVHRSGEFNVSNGWSTILNTTRTITLEQGRKTSLGRITLPEGNITVVRVGVVNATVQRTTGGSWENVLVPSGRLEMPASAQVRAQTMTRILVDIHLVCPPSNGHTGGCLITPVLHDEE